MGQTSFLEWYDLIAKRASKDRWLSNPCVCLCGIGAGRIAGACAHFRARRMRFAIQIIATRAITHGARKASATPIMRRLHINAATPCASVLRKVANSPVWDETMLPWL